MEITLPLSSLIGLAIGSVGVTLAVVIGLLLLLQKHKKHPSVGLLAALLLLSGLTLLNQVLTTSGITNRIPQLYFIPIYYSLSIAPLFYLFVQSKFKRRLHKWDFLHLLLPLFQALVYWTIGFRSVAFKAKLYEQEAFRLYMQIEGMLFPVFLVLYTLLAWRFLKKEDSQSFFWTDDIKKWLRQFAVGMLLIALLEFGFSLLEYYLPRPTAAYPPLYLIQTLLLSAFVFWIALNGIKQYYPLQVFTSAPKLSPPLIDEDEMTQLLSKLKSLMTQDKLFLNPDLNLALLSNYLGISKKRCSRLLSKGLGLNFNQYINQFRVQAFKERIQAGQHQSYTLTSIAYECGFDSKSTFNRVFKPSCGLTPSEFAKKAQQAP